MSISWTGLTKVISDFQEVLPKKLQKNISQATSDLFDLTLQKYVDNLSGGQPSTDSAPLPVGIDTGDLLGHAEQDSHMLNQYAFEIRNDSDHAGYIEFGTEKMQVARAPLQDAVNQLESEMDTVLDDVVQQSFEQ